MSRRRSATSPSHARPGIARLAAILVLVAILPLLGTPPRSANAADGLAFHPPADIVTQLRPQHPRILVDDTRLAQIEEAIATTATGQRLRDELVVEADKIIGQPVSVYDYPDGRTLLLVTRQVQHRVAYLGMAYRLTDDQRYADRLWNELSAVADFPDWNEVSFLSVAELLHAFALGYDWLHDDLTVEQRAKLRTAMVDKGLLKARDQYDRATSWTTGTNNWNVVCNGAVIMAALAIGDEEPALANDLLQRAFTSLPHGVGEYGPDGGYPEGTSYWGYATRFLVAAIGSLQTAVGDDYGISDAPGLDRTMDFHLQMTGPTGLEFNFADAGIGSGTGGPAAGYWLAALYDQPAYAWWADQGAATTSTSDSPTHLMGLGQITPVDPGSDGLPLDRDFERVGVSVMRSSWDRNATYVGFRAGNNQASHGDLDMGTFVLDALGVRWANELSSDSYSLPGYFGDQRWSYYRKRAEGQNTLVLNPGSDPDQSTAGVGRIVKREQSPAASLAVADLTSAYTQHGVTRWHRGIAQVDGRSRVVVQDEVTSTRPVTPWWFMHTGADIEVAADGRSATLSLGGRRMSVRLLDPPAGARFASMAAEPLPTSPNPAGQTANALRKLVVTSDPTTDFRLTVLLEPLAAGTPSAPPVVTALTDWSVPQVGAVRLTGITVDGQPVAGFGAESLRYVVDRSPGGSLPVVAATAADGVPVTVTQATSLPGKAVVCAGTDCAVRYEVAFQDVFGDLVAASTVGTNPPSHVLDHNLATLWTANGKGQWIQANLPAATTVSGVSLAWSLGTQRVYGFRVETSLDGQQWTEVLAGASSGTTLELEDHAFAPHSARYVRVIGLGNNSNDWNSMAELRVITPDGRWPAAAPPPTAPRLVTLVATPTASSLDRLQVLSVTHRATWSDGTVRTIDPTGLTLRSTDPAVAVVTADGRVAARSLGRTTITAEYRDGGRLAFARTDVTVPDRSLLTVPVTRDSYVFDGAPDTNYGTAQQLVVKSATAAGATRQGYLAFDLSGLDPTRIVSATLKIRAGVRDDRTMAIAIHRAGASWDEKSLTWNNKPAIDPAVLATVVAPGQRTDLRVDLTAAVRDSAGSTLGLAVQQAVGDTQLATASVASRETGATGAGLEIVLAPPRCDTTLTGQVTNPVVADGTTVCVTAATVTAPISVRNGGVLRIADSTVTASISAVGAAEVTITDSRLDGAVRLTGNMRVWLARTAVAGAVVLDGSKEFAVLDTVRVTGPLSCRSNTTTPILIESSATGRVTGQCTTG